MYMNKHVYLTHLLLLFFKLLFSPLYPSQCQWVVSALLQLHRLAKGMFRSSYGHKDQQQIADLQKQYDLLRTISGTMAKYVWFLIQNNLYQFVTSYSSLFSYFFSLSKKHFIISKKYMYM